MILDPKDRLHYRPCVGVVIFNPLGKVWLGHRVNQNGPYVWQFPQGGIDQGENIEHAALREMEEETGISVNHVAPLGQTASELFYDYPADIQQNPRTQKWRGQRQVWFALRFSGTDQDININNQTPPEFSDWQWAKLSETPNLIVPFKRKVYQSIAAEFMRFSNV